MKSIAGKRSRAPHGVCAYLHEPARHCMVINETYEAGVNTSLTAVVDVTSSIEENAERGSVIMDAMETHANTGINFRLLPLRPNPWVCLDLCGLSKKDLVNGPAKVCLAYGFTKLHNGINLLDKNAKIYLEDSGFKPKKVERTTRIGISKGKDLEYRFYCDEFEKRS